MFVKAISSQIWDIFWDTLVSILKTVAEHDRVIFDLFSFLTVFR